MKSKIIGGIAILAVAIWNVYYGMENGDLQDVSLTSVEALANGGENTGWDWWTQGATKDEEIITKPCTEGINLIIWYVEWQGTRIICKDGGNENCSVQWCSE